MTGAAAEAENVSPAKEAGVRRERCNNPEATRTTSEGAKDFDLENRDFYIICPGVAIPRQG
jgi:hypothetical protein